MSDVLTTGLDVLAAGAEAPLGDTGLAAAFDGVTPEVTFKGRAADDGGGMVTERYLCGSGLYFSDRLSNGLRITDI